jgi:hypothetical protein
MLRSFLLSILVFAAVAQLSVAKASESEFTKNAPAWMKNDLARKAAWLPRELKTGSLEDAFIQKWNAIPFEIQIILEEQKIPAWQIALIPLNSNNRDEILKQLRFSATLAGNRAASPIANRFEQLLVFAGSAQLPTPGDSASGRSLGAEGCTAALSKYILAQLKLEFPQQLAGLPTQLTSTQSSVEMKRLFEIVSNAHPDIVSVKTVPFSKLKNADVKPGSLMIAQKPGGTHTIAWSRVPSAWNWNANDKMAIANTGLSQFGQRMILAQEYLTDSNGPLHNEHGPLNSRNVIMRGGQADLSDPRTNVYAVKGSQFIIIDFK